MGSAFNRAVSKQDSISWYSETGAEFQFEPPGFDARKLQQVLGEPRQARGVVANDFDEAAAVGGVVQRAAQQRFRKSLDGRQRRAKFVRHVGHEILAHALQPPQFGDVMQHQHRAGVRARRAPAPR